MKLNFTFIDEDSSQRIIVKNKGEKVFYHDSEVHDSGEYEEVTGKVLKLEPKVREIVNTFYTLAGKLILT